MQYRLQSYLYQIYKSTKRHHEVIQDLMLNDSIVIHFRCGDVLTVKGSGTYGFAGFSYYEDALKRWGLNSNLTKTIKQMKIYIVINLNKNNARMEDKKNMDSCQELINILKPGFDKMFEKLGIVYIMGNGTINTDSYLISGSQYVLCMVSTFCQLISIGNKHNVILRDIHFWRDNPYFGSKVKLLSIKDRNIHPGGKMNVTDIADWIMYH